MYLFCDLFHVFLNSSLQTGLFRATIISLTQRNEKKKETNYVYSSDLLVHLELGSGKDVLYGAYLTTISKKDYATYIAQDGGQ